VPQKIPDPPKIRIELVHERESDKTGFANIRRLELVAHYPDGAKSGTFKYDAVDRRALDAVVICATYKEQGRHYLYLRSAVRPPLALRGDRKPSHGGNLWELPAGLIEVGETAEEAGARETEEELGFAFPVERVKPLGHCAAPSPGVIGELHHFVRVEVAPNERREPSLDGSPLERGGEVIAIPLDEALALAREGFFEDGKTELGIRRLADVLLANG
jgi:8-oxo-dGTP pyrophosphatase MutT (NUDIX family)